MDTALSTIPSGPEFGNSHIEMDIGWLAGEIFELAILGLIDFNSCLKFLHHFTSGYALGTSLTFDITKIQMYAFARIILHACDYFCSFGDISGAGILLESLLRNGSSFFMKENRL